MPHFRETKYYWMVILQHKFNINAKSHSNHFALLNFTKEKQQEKILRTIGKVE